MITKNKAKIENRDKLVSRKKVRQSLVDTMDIQRRNAIVLLIVNFIVVRLVLVFKALRCC